MTTPRFAVLSCDDWLLQRPKVLASGPEAPGDRLNMPLAWQRN